jgi:intron-binding protein aquarius
MTCTHAAMNRRRLIEIGFKYDTIIMEEAAQILEIETLIPYLLQDTDPVDGCRLKRSILIGDHFQLPPIVQSVAIQKYSKLDQSLFTRFIRLGVSYVLLDKQGRARSELSDLYRWRYSAFGKNLGNIDSVLSQYEFQLANSGFLNTFQLINVPPFQGQGEVCPTPHFYQNLGEAEYVVAVYQFMRLMGYPAKKISIITTYNGQKHLIRDIVDQRCRGPLFGRPAAITTVDKYQGQQNDYILLSMVRTESVGHIRDIRRLVVAMSRARLGLYVFCRQSIFENCHELSQTFNILKTKPSKLQLVVGESYGDSMKRKVDNKVKAENIHTVDDVTAMGVLVYQMAQMSQNKSI